MACPNPPGDAARARVSPVSFFWPSVRFLTKRFLSQIVALSPLRSFAPNIARAFTLQAQQRTRPLPAAQLPRMLHCSIAPKPPSRSFRSKTRTVAVTTAQGRIASAGEAWCAAHGYRLVETFADAGVSATNDSRPEFQRKSGEW